MAVPCKAFQIVLYVPFARGHLAWVAEPIEYLALLDVTDVKVLAGAVIAPDHFYMACCKSGGPCRWKRSEWQGRGGPWSWSP